MPARLRLFLFVVFAAFIVISIGGAEQARFVQNHQDHQQTNTKHKTKEDQVPSTGDVNERIAQYTFWLVAFTGILAAAILDWASGL